jgi:hypothetical protein
MYVPSIEVPDTTGRVLCFDELLSTSKAINGVVDAAYPIVSHIDSLAVIVLDMLIL